MFRITLLFVGLVPIFCGCSAVSPQSTQRAQRDSDLQSVGAVSVPPELYEKMAEGHPLYMGDIIALCKAHVSDEVIVRYIQHHSKVYPMNQEKIDFLRNIGATDDLIDVLVQSEHTDYPSTGGGGQGSPAATAEAGAVVGLARIAAVLISGALRR